MNDGLLVLEIYNAKHDTSCYCCLLLCTVLTSLKVYHTLTALKQECVKGLFADLKLFFSFFNTHFLKLLHCR